MTACIEKSSSIVEYGWHPASKFVRSQVKVETDFTLNWASELFLPAPMPSLQHPTTLVNKYHRLVLAAALFQMSSIFASQWSPGGALWAVGPSKVAPLSQDDDPMLPEWVEIASYDSGLPFRMELSVCAKPEYHPAARLARVKWCFCFCLCVCEHGPIKYMIHQKYCSKYSSLLKLPPVAVLPPITHVGAALLRQYSVERLSIQA